MDQRQRMTKLRLSWFKHYEEKGHNLSKTCRYFGISRPTYYFWHRRYQVEGLDGLVEHSRRPKTSPNAIDTNIVRQIIKLRKNMVLGPVRISHYLANKYNNLKISSKTIYLILKRNKLNKLTSI